MNLKKGILLLLVGIAVIGLTAGSVSAYSYNPYEPKCGDSDYAAIYGGSITCMPSEPTNYEITQMTLQEASPEDHYVDPYAFNTCANFGRSNNNLFMLLYCKVMGIIH